MSKADKFSFWFGIALCLFMIIFENRFLSSPNHYDDLFYLFMIFALSIAYFWNSRKT